MGLYLLSFLLLLSVVIILFITIDPAFGGNPTKEQKEMYQHLNNYVDGKFINEDPTELVINSSDASSTNKDSASEAKDRNPTEFPFLPLTGTKLKVKMIV